MGKADEGQANVEQVEVENVDPDPVNIGAQHAGHDQENGHWDFDGFQLQWANQAVDHRNWRPNSPEDSGMSDSSSESEEMDEV